MINRLKGITLELLCSNQVYISPNNRVYMLPRGTIRWAYQVKSKLSTTIFPSSIRTSLVSPKALSFFFYWVYITRRRWVLHDRSFQGPRTLVGISQDYLLFRPTSLRPLLSITHQKDSKLTFRDFCFFCTLLLLLLEL